MKYRSIKEKAKKAIRYHLFYSIIVCFLMTSILNVGYKFTSINNISLPGGITPLYRSINNYGVFIQFLREVGINVDVILKLKPTYGVFASFFNQLSGTGSIILSILNVINNFAFGKRMASENILILSILVYLLIYIFVSTILNVGKSRYFLEHYTYQDTNVDKLLFVYYTKSIFNVGEVMLIRMLKQTLWYFTIIGGFIKHYEYYMIPYILAENPNVNYKMAFKLSKEMTTHKKWKLFMLDVTFIPWYILGFLTFGLTNVFYFRPYKEMVKASIYLEYRKKFVRAYPNIFKDTLLGGESTKGSYPKDEYFIKELRSIKWLKVNFKVNYDLWDIILIFFTIACIGWIWEINLCLIYEERLVNKGTMFGPYLPIYGYGSILIIILLKKYRDKPFVVFLLSLFICGAIEYGTAWYLETFKGLKWWDYTGFFLNIHGRICLEGLIFFGLGGTIITYLVGPLLHNWYHKVPMSIKRNICLILVGIYLVDLVYSHYHPNTGEGITKPVDSLIIEVLSN